DHAVPGCNSTSNTSRAADSPDHDHNDDTPYQSPFPSAKDEGYPTENPKAATSSGRRLVAVGAGLAAALRRALGQDAVDFRHQLPAHLLARRIVEPVEEPAAGGRLTQAAVGFEAGPGEELLDLGHRL